MKKILTYLCLVSILLLVGACGTTPEQEVTEVTTEQAPNPFVGTWVLNVAKSEFNPPDSALKSATVVIGAQENGLTFTFDSVDAEGNEAHSEAAPKFDENTYPVTGNESEDSVKMKRLDANSFESVSYKDGEEVSDVQVVISDDGQTSTATIKTKAEDGQEVTSVLVYDKQ